MQGTRLRLSFSKPLPHPHSQPHHRSPTGSITCHFGPARQQRRTLALCLAEVKQWTNSLVGQRVAGATVPCRRVGAEEDRPVAGGRKRRRGVTRDCVHLGLAVRRLAAQLPG